MEDNSYFKIQHALQLKFNTYRNYLLIGLCFSHSCTLNIILKAHLFFMHVVGLLAVYMHNFF